MRYVFSGGSLTTWRVSEKTSLHKKRYQVIKNSRNHRSDAGVFNKLLYILFELILQAQFKHTTLAILQTGWDCAANTKCADVRRCQLVKYVHYVRSDDRIFKTVINKEIINGLLRSDIACIHFIGFTCRRVPCCVVLA